MRKHVTLTLTESQHRSLTEHLFPGDNDEHGAVLAVGVADSGNATRLLGHHVFIARDGRDYVPGNRGYRQLRAEFIADCLAYCRERQLGYLAIHNHGGVDEVAFSSVDLLSHQRGYPALLDILGATPVGGLVFARRACAGDIWFPNGQRLTLDAAQLLGVRSEALAPRRRAEPDNADARFDRQVKMFGEGGQAKLRSTRVAIIGLGGVGILLVEYLARLGVRDFLLIDPERVEISNLPRLSGASSWDAWLPLSHYPWPKSVRRWAAHHGTWKTTVARRVARRASSNTRITAVRASVARPEAAIECRACDFLFLAADSMQARLVFNALVHQYLIPGLQVGSKVVVNKENGILEDAYSVIRWVLPGYGCLWCNGLISPQGLAWEAKTSHEQAAQRYGTPVANPSVITLNAVGAALAANEFMTHRLGLISEDTIPVWRRVHHLTRESFEDLPRKTSGCPECEGRFGLGDAKRLPVEG